MHKARRTLMHANGAFLALVGGAQMSFELLSYYAGSGPLGKVFAGSHYTIGWVEAHIWASSKLSATRPSLAMIPGSTRRSASG